MDGDRLGQRRRVLLVDNRAGRLGCVNPGGGQTGQLAVGWLLASVRVGGRKVGSTETRVEVGRGVGVDGFGFTMTRSAPRVVTVCLIPRRSAITAEVMINLVWVPIFLPRKRDRQDDAFAACRGSGIELGDYITQRTVFIISQIAYSKICF